MLFHIPFSFRFSLFLLTFSFSFLISFFFSILVLRLCNLSLTIPHHFPSQRRVLYLLHGERIENTITQFPPFLVSLLRGSPERSEPFKYANESASFSASYVSRSREHYPYSLVPFLFLLFFLAAQVGSVLFNESIGRQEINSP